MAWQCGLLPFILANTAMFSPRTDFVKNYRCTLLADLRTGSEALRPRVMGKGRMPVARKPLPKRIKFYPEWSEEYQADAGSDEYGVALDVSALKLVKLPRKKMLEKVLGLLS